ncbi:unnamed protein product [Angiostrongylus costaricensis]|uniref:Secreted protein n=1 Tax=Angiostrongylus costaricensis TaxID=334426 RepID=A0A0R3PJM0_ANGCS|nr:unnamed protein product [Angiostrongylus costaricensis]
MVYGLCAFRSTSYVCWMSSWRNVVDERVSPMGRVEESYEMTISPDRWFRTTEEAPCFKRCPIWPRPMVCPFDIGAVVMTSTTIRNYER